MRKKRNKAIALQYNPVLPAPLIIAKGFGFIADDIKKRAREAEVPIVENSELSEELEVLQVGDLIPVSCYQVVAELLAFVRTLNRSKDRYERNSG